MPTIQDTIIRAVKKRGYAILCDKDTLSVVLEDLSPDLYKERDFIDQVYNNGVGKILFEACLSESSRKTEYLREADKYLDEENGRNESWRKRLMSYFEKAVLGDYNSMSSDSNTVKTDQKITGTLDGSNQKTEENEESSVWILIKKAKANDDKRALVQLYSLIHDGSEGEKEAQMFLGEYRAENGQMEEAFEHYLRAADLGDVRAQFVVGSMYEDGEGVSRDLRQAAKWYIRAAENGDRNAQHKLGCFFYSGLGEVQDFKRAFEYFMKAERQGKPESMLNIGIMYENGQYVKRNWSEALRWYKKASYYGLPYAEQYYERLYREVCG